MLGRLNPSWVVQEPRLGRLGRLTVAQKVRQTDARTTPDALAVHEGGLMSPPFHEALEFNV